MLMSKGRHIRKRQLPPTCVLCGALLYWTGNAWKCRDCHGPEVTR